MLWAAKRRKKDCTQEIYRWLPWQETKTTILFCFALAGLHWRRLNNNSVCFSSCRGQEFELMMKMRVWPYLEEEAIPLLPSHELTNSPTSRERSLGVQRSVRVKGRCTWSSSLKVKGKRAFKFLCYFLGASKPLTIVIWKDYSIKILCGTWANHFSTALWSQCDLLQLGWAIIFDRRTRSESKQQYAHEQFLNTILKTPHRCYWCSITTIADILLVCTHSTF